MNEVELPWSLHQNPRLGQWIDLSEPGVARIFTAKVELGQGILTALAQIAAEELRLPIAKIRVVSGDTRYSPDESYTAGSMSIEIGGSSLRIACAEAREALLRQAVRKLDVDLSRLSLGGGAILLDGKPSGLDYWALAAGVDWELPVVGSALLTDPGDASYLGQNIARLDLPAKLLGGAFVQDLELPRMLHGRVLRPPSPHSQLAQVDLSVVQRLPGIVKVWRNRDFVGICCEREYQAVKALEALRASVRWTEDERLPAGEDWKEWLLKQRSLDSQNEIGEPVTAQPDLIRCSAWYSKPPLAHASIGPSCAIAHFSGGELSVWTQSQGVFPLRAALARALGLDLIGLSSSTFKAPAAMGTMVPTTSHSMLRCSRCKSRHGRCGFNGCVTTSLDGHRSGRRWRSGLRARLARRERWSTGRPRFGAGRMGGAPTASGSSCWQPRRLTHRFLFRMCMRI